MKKIKKEVGEFAGKKVYLLGRDKDGKRVYLEAAKWDCGWYWGFGYIERYNKNKPDHSTDILSHTHWNTEIIGKQNYYDSDKGCWRQSSDYIHHFNANPTMKETTLTDNESWELADLMASFYTLKDAAALLGSGSSHISTPQNAKKIKRKRTNNHINQQIMPELFKRVVELLTPDAPSQDGDK